MCMNDKYKSKMVVLLMLIRNSDKNTEVLLHRRYKTGYLDGMYDFVGGHVEKNESLETAIIRESKEEIGIEIEKKDLEFVTMMHLYQKDYIYVFFTT